MSINPSHPNNSPIISQVIGGLGNQLFQYAAARSLAHKLNRPLVFDISAFSHYKLRNFLLSRYGIPMKLISPQDLWTWKLQQKRWRHLIPRSWRIHEIRETEHHFQELQLPKKDKKLYLIGYWQSEKYFLPIADLIRDEVRLPNEPTGLNATVLRQIRSTEAVALHIRRGDYVSDPTTAAYHGVCGLDYYQKAIAHIEKQVRSPHFFIFSDDMPWVKTNLHIKHPVTYVDHNSNDPCEDLRLMSACQHFIIANSSFSWWGAWLSEHQQKIVIAPKKWFLTPEKDDRDIAPETWLRI